MSMALTQMTRFWLAGFALVGFGGLAACTSDEDDPGVDQDDGSMSSSDSGSGGSTSTADTKCAFPVPLASSAPAIADFDDYDGAADLSTWSFPLGGDVSVGVFAGPFGYGDEADGFPEAFEMVEGHDSTYALSVSDTDSQEYGGGMGIWISTCLDASEFSGLSLWVRGNSPTGDAKLSLLVEETTPEADGEAVGTCTGTIDECIHPSFTFPVSEEWTEVQVAWEDFAVGTAAGSRIRPDGSNVWQIQFDIGLEWLPDDTGEYQPVPGEYELVIDDLTFY